MAVGFHSPLFILGISGGVEPEIQGGCKSVIWFWGGGGASESKTPPIPPAPDFLPTKGGGYKKKKKNKPDVIYIGPNFDAKIYHVDDERVNRTSLKEDRNDYLSDEEEIMVVLKMFLKIKDL